MKFGFLLPTCIEGLYLNPSTIGPDGLRAIARRAEELGFDTLWANDHLAPWQARREENQGQPLNWYEPLTTLAHCAFATKRIRLAVGVIVMPFRDTILLAKQVATLDVFSQGRFIFGLGIGGARDEFEISYPRLAKASRSAMLDESLEALKLLFTGRTVSFDGKYYAFRDVTLIPKPVQDPLPLYISGNRASAFERVAKYASGLMTMAAPISTIKAKVDGLRSATEKIGRHPSSIDVAVSALLCLDTTHEGAIKKLLNSRMGKRFFAGRPDFEQLVAEHLVGTPKEVAEKIHRLGQIGVTHIVPQHIAGDTFSLMMEQMELLGQEVLPLCRET